MYILYTLPRITSPKPKRFLQEPSTTGTSMGKTTALPVPGLLRGIFPHLTWCSDSPRSVTWWWQLSCQDFPFELYFLPTFQALLGVLRTCRTPFQIWLADANPARRMLWATMAGQWTEPIAYWSLDSWRRMAHSAAVWLIAFFLPDMLCWKEVWASVVRKEAAKKTQCHERIVQALRQREARKRLPLSLSLIADAPWKYLLPHRNI